MDKSNNYKNESSSRTSECKENKHDGSRKSGQKRPSDDNRQFVKIPPQSINIIAESIGISDLPSDILPALAEDVSYKLREILHHCNIAMKNTKRSILTTEEVSKACESFNVPQMYGYSSTNGNDIEFMEVPESDVYISTDEKLDLYTIVMSDLNLCQYKDQYVKGTWCIVDSPDQSAVENKEDGKQRGLYDNPQPGTSTEGSAPPPVKQNPLKPGSKPDDPSSSRPPAHLLNYYLQIAKVILSGSTPLLEIALFDLRTNPNVSPVCPYFLNLVALSVNKLQRHMWLTDALLSTVKALVENQFIDPSCFLAANRAANSLLVIAIEPKVASSCDDLLLRNRAAELLAKVLLTWTLEMKQQMDIVRQLLQLLIDKNISLHSQYGAIVCLTALGYRILFMYFWPVMEHYFPILDEKCKTTFNIDIVHVKGAIMMAAELMNRKDYQSCTPDEVRKRLKVDYLLQDYFGDMYVSRRHLLKRRTIYPVVQPNESDECEYDYQNWTPSYMIQHKPLAQTTNVYVNSRLNVLPIDVNAVFTRTRRNRFIQEISFNFEGAKQIDSSQLKRPVFNLPHLQYSQERNKLLTMYYNQNIYKNTKTIKYCVKSHSRSCAGDLYVVL